MPVRNSADGGKLSESGFVTPPVITGAGVLVRLGFGGPAAPYAAPVHENPRAGKTGGVSPSGHRYKSWAEVGQWKYLEIPFYKWAPTLPVKLAQRIKRDWKAWLT